MIRNYNLNPLSKRKLKKLELNEIETLLDIIPEATILIDGRDGQIVGSNAAATELSAFTRVELANMYINELFTESANNILDEILKSIGRTTYWDLTMIKRGGGTINIKASTITLDHELEKLVLTLEPVTLLEQREAKRERQRQIWDGLQTLSSALLEKGIEDALNLVLEACFILTSSSSVALYQAVGDNPGLRRTYIIGASHLLPEETQPNDLATLQKPTLWTSGKRTETNLHRHARSIDISYLASVPIGQRNASVGLLVATSQLKNPAEDILEVLKFTGVLITSIIQEHTLLAHLQNTIEEYNSALIKHNLITRSIQNGIIILNPDLTIREMNTFAEDALGYSSNEVQGKAVDKILISSDEIKPQLEETLNGASHLKLDNNRLYRRNGQAFLANIQIHPIKEVDITGAIIIFRDLSEQEEYRTLNQQLEQRALLGEVTASFAHEVRNPIHNMSTGLQLLASNLVPDDPNRDVVRRIQEDCDRLTELIKSSLTIVRPMEFKMKPIDISSLMKFILDRSQARLLRANIQYNIQVDPNVPLGHGDFSALEHVFQNLIDNAIQAMGDDGGTLSLKIRLFHREGESEYVEVNISDTGPGIPANIRDRIFEPFYTTKLNGTGLGLAIVKRILTAHKGVIYVESIPGATVFQVRLPVAKTQ